MIPMPDGAVNAGQALARVLVDELVRAGVTDTCLAPGSRSAPLALALAERDEIRLHVHIDERSAAFLALGIAKASRRPVPVVVTSGSAAAHLHPALIEAHHARIPLIALTADRPPELRATGAGQTIDQVKIFGDAVRLFAEVGAPDDRAENVRYWRSVTARALAAATGAPRGPVHLNLAFRDPLHAVPDAHGFPHPLGGRTDGAPWVRVERAPRPPGDDAVAAIAEEVASAEHGLIVAGEIDAHDPAAAADAVVAFADATGWPLIAEPQSGARRGPYAISTAEALLRHEPFARAHSPDVVVRVGRVATSKPLLAFVDSARQILVDPDAAWIDPSRSCAVAVDADPALLLGALAKTAPQRRDGGWTRSWLDAERRAREALDAALDGDDDPFEGRIARDVSAMLPTNAALVVASSMPVRDLDWFMAPRTGPRVYANRGANGIDGFASTALGVALANTGGPTVALTGDLSMLHDANGLLLTRNERVSVTFVVLNNDGGGIFSFLPYAGDPDFDRLFGTPLGVDLSALADLHGAGYARVERADGIMRAILEARGRGGVHVVEVPTDRASNVAKHRAAFDAVAAVI